MVLSWMVRVTMVMMRITVTMVTGLTTGMMRATSSTMGMINTINTTSLGFLLITSLEHHWPNRQQIHTTYNSEASISLLQTGGWHIQHSHSIKTINSTRGSSHTIKKSKSCDILIHTPLISFSSQLHVGKYSNRDTTHQSTHKHPTNSNTNCQLKWIMSSNWY